MANLKFSEFSEQTNPINVEYLVGYNGTTNVKIDPSYISNAPAKSLGGVARKFDARDFSMQDQLPAGTSDGQSFWGDPGVSFLGDSIILGLGYVYRIEFTLIASNPNDLPNSSVEYAITDNADNDAPLGVTGRIVDPNRDSMGVLPAFTYIDATTQNRGVSLRRITALTTAPDLRGHFTIEKMAESVDVKVMPDDVVTNATLNSTNGKFRVDNLTQEWGTVSTDASGTLTVNLQTRFVNGNFNIQATLRDGPAYRVSYQRVNDLSFTLTTTDENGSGVSNTVDFLVMGAIS